MKWRIGFIIFMFIGCARAPVKSPDQALRPASMPELADDLADSGLADGLKAQIQFLKRQKGGVSEFGFGPRVIPREDYIKSLEYLAGTLEGSGGSDTFRKVLREDFEALEVYGQKRWGEVFITSYFEPVIDGSPRPTPVHTEPLYAKPKDLVDIDLGAFIPLRPALSVLEDVPTEQRSQLRLLRGRILPQGDDVETPRVVPYPDRAGIYASGLKNQAKVLCYVDPIDAFILEIQGSGVVRLKRNQELKVGYAAQNGHPYVPIGRFMTDVIPKEQLTLFTIESHLRSLPKDEARKIMELNPSYVFFRPLKTQGITFLGNELVTGRTIATDQLYFPKGTLALLSFSKPVFAAENATEPKEWQPASRFVFDQDTGGAIRGPGRVDLFSGRGGAAKQIASVMKNTGRLVYFVPKPALIERLRSPGAPQIAP